MLSIMVGMAALALVFALYTQRDRRKRDPRPKTDAETLLAQEPSRLLALGFLPKGSEIIVGLQMAGLRQSRAGASLLQEPRPALIENALSKVETLGIAQNDVDHVVLAGASKDLLQWTTVIVTRAPYDLARLKEALGPSGATESDYRGKPLFKLTKLPQIPKLWCAEPRVLVHTTLKTEDLARIPSDAKAAGDTLTPAARKALADRLNKQSRAWVVADLENAGSLVDLGLLTGVLSKEQARVLRVVQSLAVGITVEDTDGPVLIGDFHTPSAVATQELRKYLEETSFKGAASQKVAAPPAEVQDAEAQWVTWQVRADADAMREAIASLQVVARKTAK